ncbi:MAG TPA: hypothetical protein VI819_01940 [Patescibacteria group bacterium]|nr:hypothetical protein [Patescibacteria group bacterium]
MGVEYTPQQASVALLPQTSPSPSDVEDRLTKLNANKKDRGRVLAQLYKKAKSDSSFTNDFVTLCVDDPDLGWRAFHHGVTVEAKKTEHGYESIPHIILPKP